MLSTDEEMWYEWKIFLKLLSKMIDEKCFPYSIHCLGILFKEYEKLYKEECKIAKNNPKPIDPNSSKDQFDKTIFCGMGAHTGYLVTMLHERLDVALDYLSGQQQNGGMGTEFDHEFDEKAEKFKEIVVWDIITSLGLKHKFASSSHIAENIKDPKVNFGSSF